MTKYASGQTCAVAMCILRTMPDRVKPPKNISELIDRIDLIRDELLTIQRSMEKMEKAQAAASKNEGK